METPWYSRGLAFECTSCGRCCTGRGSYVWVTVEEAAALAARFELSLDDFGRRYLRRVGGRYALVDGPRGDCVFLKGKLCTVYDHRPQQCRTFPWWPDNLESPEAWQQAARDCEGIRDDAPVVSADRIGQVLNTSRSGLRGTDK